jgi:hypothetical protein
VMAAAIQFAVEFSERPTVTYGAHQYLCFGRRFVLATRYCCLGRFEASFRVGSVAKWLGGGAAAAAQSKRTLGNRVSDAVPVNRRHIVALDEIGSVLKHLDRCHWVISGSVWRDTATSYHRLWARPGGSFENENNDYAFITDRTRIRGPANVHANWTSADETWEVLLWGNNVTDHRYIVNATELTAFLRQHSRVHGDRCRRLGNQQNVCRPMEHAEDVWHLGDVQTLRLRPGIWPGVAAPDAVLSRRWRFEVGGNSCKVPV